MPAVAFDPKDPDSTLDYVWDWSCWAEGDQLVSAVFSVEPVGGLVIDRSSVDPETNRALVWLSGGTVGESNLVKCRITTSGGRIDERSVYISIKSR